MARRWQRTGIGISAVVDKRGYMREWMRKRRNPSYLSKERTARAVVTAAKPKPKPPVCFGCQKPGDLKPIERMRLVLSPHRQLVPVTVLWCGRC